MIYEIRTYRVKVGSLPEVEKRFGEGYEYRKKISPLAAFWHTEIGPLNEIIHVWPYADLGERNRLRAEAVKAGNWPPKIAEFIETMQSEIVVPFAFLPDLKPGKMGPYFEMRYYTMKAGTLPDLVKRWESKIEERMKMSPVALAGHVEHGEANRFIHIWAYKSLDERTAVRNKRWGCGRPRAGATPCSPWPTRSCSRPPSPRSSSRRDQGSESRKSSSKRLKASGWSRFEECPAPRITSSLARGIFFAMYSQGARKGWS